MEQFLKIRVNNICFLFLLLFIFGVYSNTFNASWQFDDKPNIVDNSPLKIKDLKPKTLWNTFFAKPGHVQLYRPLPCITFSLNWYWGKGNPFGFHVVNTFIHLINTTFLYITIVFLFKTPNLAGKYNHSEINQIAFWGVALWAVNPIQTQAVTYIVQRMASMAALFYILGILLYIKGRLSESEHQKKKLFFGTLLCFFGAVGSKENGVLLPFSLLLVEIIFFQNTKAPEFRKKYFWLGLFTLVIIFLIGAFFLINGFFFSYLQGYNIRPFSFSERLLTEPRIIFYYLSLIFFPTPYRLSIEHDLLISTSLFTPWSTLPAILLCAFLIGIGIWQIRDRPLLAFGFLFYFLNHVVESTIIPLELIFEHRNYLPSFFLFVPIAAITIDILKKYLLGGPIIKKSFAMFAGLLIVVLGFGTYVRNQAWRTEQSLWEDAMLKAPGMARPLNNLGVCLAWGESSNPKKTEAALQLFEKALLLRQSRRLLEVETLGNIGKIYLEKEEYEIAADYYRQAIKVDPNYIKGHYDLIRPLVLMGNWPEAESNVDWLLEKENNKADYYNLKGLILLWQNRAEESIPYLKKALLLAPQESSILFNAGISLSMTGQNQKANYFLNLASQNCPEDMIVFLALIENNLKAGHVDDAKIYTDRLFNSFNLDEINSTINKLPTFYASAPVSEEIVAPWVKKNITDRIMRR